MISIELVKKFVKVFAPGYHVVKMPTKGLARRRKENKAEHETIKKLYPVTET
jgi:hypothetical protein